ncbi:hypothetical protein BOTBODRAFT_144850 [Botryobasidium botryosum FD-172 SS1]|uniref:F-box domain-containing protein n=1 Tax=Botryobasidium botryosum (strain FD-172 SS1) TaxID=930990 RepID=A0A067MW52_BOTB1|nr:hypothetical protein BOTBODRAFT_144850 [Botryobasidium botryosum FD-172 SS1]
MDSNISIDIVRPLLWTPTDRTRRMCHLLGERSGEKHTEIAGPAPGGAQAYEARALYWSCYANRWGSLKIQCSLSSLGHSGVLRWLLHPAPALEALDISTYWNHGQQRGLDVSLDIQMPRLREINLAGFYLPLTLPIFRGLASLRLSRITYDDTFATDLLRVVTECPALEELCLDDLRINASTSQDKSRKSLPPAIDLSHLRALSLLHVPVREIQYLLAHISTPPHSTLEIALNHLQSEESLTHAFPSNLTHLSNLSSVIDLEFSVIGDTDNRTCLLQGRNNAGICLLSISVDGDKNTGPVQRIMASLGPSLSIMPLQTLILRQYANRRWSASAFCRTLDCFSSIRVLGFDGCHEKFLKALAYSTGRPTCLSLESLVVSNCAISTGPLSHLVRSRLAHSNQGMMACLKEVQLFGSRYADTDTVAALSPYVKTSWNPESLV